MKKYVKTVNQIEGVHYWKDATGAEEYLKHKHRHVFGITCWFRVLDSDREIEIIQQQYRVQTFIEGRHGLFPAEFGNMSCEMIAEEIMLWFDKCECCEVTEDGFGGAMIRR